MIALNGPFFVAPPNPTGPGGPAAHGAAAARAAANPGGAVAQLLSQRLYGPQIGELEPKHRYPQVRYVT